MISFNEERQNLKISELKHTAEENSLEASASKLGIGYVDLTKAPIDADAIRMVEEKIARKAFTLPFSLVDKKVRLASTHPSSELAQAIKNDLTSKGFEPEFFLASEKSVEHALLKYAELSYAKASTAGAIDISSIDVENMIKNITSVVEVKTLIDSVLSDKRGSKVSRIIEVSVAGALALDASDIHIEPGEASCRLRFRLDGVLSDITHIDHRAYGLILSRIKLLSGLKLNVKDQSQDGRFTIIVGNMGVEIRTSIIPGSYGESIVMRVLNPDTIKIEMEKLGMNDKLLSTLKSEIERPNGMILTTGPTGSGKTTTLFAFLKKIYTPEIKVITIENPIEYHLSGVVQTQVDVKKGYTFESGLKSALRQDPDVVMVGEIRDRETAEAAIHAALTGHLVFSTLHTNNAAGAFPRLIDLGVNPKIISSSVNVALAQRLARRLCSACKNEDSPNSEEMKTISSIIESISDESQKPKIGKIWRAAGCPKCSNVGYKGRLGIFEGIFMTSDVEKVVMSSPSEREIKKSATGQNILDMKQDGIAKVLKGETSLDELGRVVDLSLDK